MSERCFSSSPMAAAGSSWACGEGGPELCSQDRSEPALKGVLWDSTGPGKVIPRTELLLCAECEKKGIKGTAEGKITARHQRTFSPPLS